MYFIIENRYSRTHKLKCRVLCNDSNKWCKPSVPHFVRPIRNLDEVNEIISHYLAMDRSEIYRQKRIFYEVINEEQLTELTANHSQPWYISTKYVTPTEIKELYPLKQEKGVGGKL